MQLPNTKLATMTRRCSIGCVQRFFDWVCALLRGVRGPGRNHPSPALPRFAREGARLYVFPGFAKKRVSNSFPRSRGKG